MAAQPTNVHAIDEAVTQHIGDGRDYQTLEENLGFRATYDANRDIVYIFLPGRSTNRTMIKPIERIAVWRKWMQTRSFSPGDYNDISRSPSYLLAVLKQVSG